MLDTNDSCDSGEQIWFIYRKIQTGAQKSMNSLFSNEANFSVKSSEKTLFIKFASQFIVLFIFEHL